MCQLLLRALRVQALFQDGPSELAALPLWGEGERETDKEGHIMPLMIYCVPLPWRQTDTVTHYALMHSNTASNRTPLLIPALMFGL